jgi:dockerin type I repeat protein
VRAQCTDIFGAGRKDGFDVDFDCRRADGTGDGKVDGLDLAMIAARFGAAIDAGHPQDLNGDGDVDGEDLALLAAHFGRLAASCR